ncbi:hypothetical protein ACEK81_02685 [Streptococcus anginosus]|uniref:hypothetical protein n=1 Tax=Streptococcus anginosus TaxID=1328 RepID=UPI001CD7910C|nr:hypothetical protein [Streptococcus anginosus]MDB8652248.1 hypothetical protein [Streptococcus anginosus]MDB8653640.1 hypothetical protein [Streptococcus anginosus]
MKNTKLLLTLFIASFMLVACSSNTASDASDSSKNNPKVETKSTSETEDVTSGNEDSSSEEETIVDIMNEAAANSKSTDEIYVTGDVVVGDKGDVTPGIYDLEITGGSGNITGTRAAVRALFINYIGSAPGSGMDYPSKIRLILFRGDVLKFRNISKIKFTAVPAKVQMSNELGIGEYVVGCDIKPGTYKLSSNANMNPELTNSGWSIDILDTSTGKTMEQRYNPGNMDVAVKLEEGQIVSTKFDNTDRNISSDEARLIFTELNQ